MPEPEDAGTNLLIFRPVRARPAGSGSPRTSSTQDRSSKRAKAHRTRRVCPCGKAACPDRDAGTGRIPFRQQ